MGTRSVPGRVIYAADDPDDDVRKTLSSRGFDVFRTDSVNETASTAVDEQVDCVVAELGLQDGDGLDCCASLRQRDEGLPFVLLVDSRDDVTAKSALAADVSIIVSRDASEGYLSTLDERIVDAIEDYKDRSGRESRWERDSEMLQSLLDNIPLSIYFKNEHSVIERASRHMVGGDDPDIYIVNDEGKVHHNAEALAGKTDFDLYAPDLARATRADELHVMHRETIIADKIEKGETPLGDDLFHSTTKAPQYDADGNIVGTLGVTLEVTERIEQQQAIERQNQRLAEFASVLSHDLRNPLNIAQAHLTALESGDDDGTSVEQCRISLDRMDQLIDDVLVFAREGRSVEEAEPVDLSATARAAWKTVDTGAATLVTDTDLPVQGDEARVKRLFENLFRNAVEHGSTGNQNASRSDDPVEHGSTSSRSTTDDAVEHGASDDAGITIRVGDAGNDFYVEDDGVGIPENKRDTVLERGVTTSSDGTGFGLAIVKNVASAHGWDVTVTESDEGGARFEFTGVSRTEVE